jgi:metal-sulfur cluster biosynthetic enzyme
MPVLREQIEEAIQGVVDPCSRFNGTFLSFVDLGMIDAIEIGEDGRVLIRLLLDDPLCPYMPDIRTELRQAVLAVPGVNDLELRLRGDEIWTEDRMTDSAREKLRGLRERRRAQFVRATATSGRT